MQFERRFGEGARHRNRQSENKNDGNAPFAQAHRPIGEEYELKRAIDRKGARQADAGNADYVGSELALVLDRRAEWQTNLPC